MNIPKPARRRAGLGIGKKENRDRFLQANKILIGC